MVLGVLVVGYGVVEKEEEKGAEIGLVPQWLSTLFGEKEIETTLPRS